MQLMKKAWGVEIAARASASWLVAVLAFVLLPAASFAGVLADDRADMLYHRYEGGGVTIHGPSLLVRKKFAEKYAVSANYYQDYVTSASIDVEVSGASQYKEERDQYSLGVEYLRGKTTYSLNYTDSKENDYKASTTTFGISQDLFGDLTTITMGFSRGNDIVQRRDTTTNQIDRNFKEPTDRWSYRVGVSQILTKNLISSLQLEVITDEGFLNNPYRSYRFINPSDDRLFALAREVYPRTRTSNAVAVNARYYLPYRAAVHGGYRFFTDTWGIGANTLEVGYTHPMRQWIFDIGYRYYAQNNADFYRDLFDRPNQQNFLARDKELSTFKSQALSLGASYEFTPNGWGFIKKGTLNFYYDRIQFDYDDFRDARYSLLPSTDPNFRAAGTEPLYSFGANVYQLFVSVWF
jgi:hypothetical protein